MKPVALVPLEDVEGGRSVVSVTTSQTKVQEVLREMLKNPRIEMLGVISRYVGR